MPSIYETLLIPYYKLSIRDFFFFSVLHVLCFGVFRVGNFQGNTSIPARCKWEIQGLSFEYPSLFLPRGYHSVVDHMVQEFRHFTQTWIGCYSAQSPRRLNVRERRSLIETQLIQPMVSTFLFLCSGLSPTHREINDETGPNPYIPFQLQFDQLFWC